MNGRKRRGYEGTGFFIVETDDGDVFRYLIPLFFDCFHGTKCNCITCRKDSGWKMFAVKQIHHHLIAGLRCETAFPHICEYNTTEGAARS